MKRTEDETAAQARDLVRRAVGDASGLTIKGQIKRAAENLGYPDGAWRVREAWYGRAGRWVGTALADLRCRFAAWRLRDGARLNADPLSQRLAAMRDGLAELQHRLEELEAEVGRALSHCGSTGPPAKR